MKILHVIPSYVPAYSFGGPVKASHDLCRTLARKGIDVSVFTTNIGLDNMPEIMYDNPKEIDGVKVSYYPVAFPRQYCYSRPLASALEENIRKFDLVHIHSVYRYTTFAAARKCVKHGKPYILNPFGALDPDMIRFKGGIKKNIYISLVDGFNIRNAEAMHLASEYEKERFNLLGFKTPAVIVQRGVDPENYSCSGATPDLRERYPQLKEKKIILYLGRIHPKKGLDLLAASFKTLIEKKPDTVLVVAGDGERKYRGKVERMFLREGLAGKVLFTGMLLGEEKTAALHASDLFVLPSCGENFGIAVIEALACGLPVVVTKNVSLSADVAKHSAGIVTDRDAGQISRAMFDILDNNSLRRSMGLRGKKLVEEKFTLDAAADRMIEVYEEITAGHAYQSN